MTIARAGGRQPNTRSRTGTVPKRRRGNAAQAVPLAVFAVAAATPPSAARAEEADPSIIVTARQIAEPVEQAPLSVTAFDQQGLDRMGADTLADVARAVPNFTLAPTGVLGAETPAIRGIFSSGGSSTVGLYVDEVPVQIRSTGFSGNADLRAFDLERIEILRGPQGTLFGANSMGGTIRFVTRQPDLTAFDAAFSAELAAVENGGLSHELNAAAGGPILSGKLGFRAAFYRRADAGHIDRVSPGEAGRIRRNVDGRRIDALRAAITAAVGSRIEVTPGLFYQRGRRDDLPFFDSGSRGRRQANIHAQPGRDDLVLPSLTARIDLGFARLTSITGFFDRRDRQVSDYSRVFGELVLGGAFPELVPEGGARSLTRVSQESLTQEVRLASPEGGTRFTWVIGAFLRDAKLGLTQEVVEPGIAELAETYLGGSVETVFGVPLLPGGISYRGVETVRARQAAAFGEMVWQLSERLAATAGLRVTRSELDLQVLSEGPYAGGTLTQPAERRQRDTPVTPRFGLSYRVGTNDLIYLTAAKGFRIGGANPPVPAASCAEDLASLGLAEAPVSYRSDRLWNYEAGVKASLARQRVGLALSTFHIDWSGIQQPVTLPNCGFSYVDNLGTARSRGFEAELTVRPLTGLQIRAALGFVDARFRRRVEGGAGGPGTARAIIVDKGDRVPFVPRWSGRIATEYRHRLGRAGQGFVRLEYQFASAYRRAPSTVSAAYDPRVYFGQSYGMMMVRLGLEAGRWRVGAFVDNLLDDRTILFNSAEFVPVTGAPLRQSSFRPRTIGLRLALRL
ncbi:TonB-dependent receptor [Sphingosinicella terrae]|uniref:TonB-dependent receptor n=1 Tax=Sphingosinicella terrae TaxID=2172047 RepID=UPI000E0DF0CF|nr:TonB-dependent receptor [Sphingosinicella terrae]